MLHQNVTVLKNLGLGLDRTVSGSGSGLPINDLCFRGRLFFDPSDKNPPMESRHLWWWQMTLLRLNGSCNNEADESGNNAC